MSRNHGDSRRARRQLRSAGETVDVDPERYPSGRFAEVRDPEGNRIHLWQPMDPA
jgi:predicted enzyme related to lactoylglutathione lyase